MGSDNTLLDRIAIRDLVESWVIYRDSADWKHLASLWHADGYIVTTTFEASAQDYIERSRKAWDAGSRIFHVHGGTSVDVAGERAVAQSKMEIIQRATVHGVLVDVHCNGRFYDFLERRDTRWGLVRRQPIYERDTMAPVDPAASMTLNADVLAIFPEGYRHLAYLQTGLGLTVRKDLPGTHGPEMEAIIERGRRWLAGEAI